MSDVSNRYNDISNGIDVEVCLRDSGRQCNGDGNVGLEKGKPSPNGTLQRNNFTLPFL